MSETVYICEAEKCDVVCIQNHCCKPHGCKGKPHCFFKATTKHQITEVPEPVYYLDIQYPIQKSDSEMFVNLRNHNKKIVAEAPDGFMDIGKEVSFDPGTIPKSWIKQKQPEPTREELQERIKDMLHAIAVRPKSYERICRIAKGEKP